MKKTLVIFLISFLISIVAFSQTTDKDIDYLQAVYGMEKRDIVEGFIQPDAIVSEDFWALYDEYEVYRKKINARKMKYLLKYVDNYDTLSNVELDELIKKTSTERRNLDKLIQKYYKKIKKGYGSRVAAQFIRVERFVLSAAQVAILESMPFIDSLGH